mmetsp:Transcript_24286/g.55329  ORF Transcript_24286/g.55329 Transcript_24286/m.55329 type:complete len:338 (+) Transcript_24286:631-1644(+)
MPMASSACHRFCVPLRAIIRIGRRLILARVKAPEKIGLRPFSGVGLSCPSGRIPMSKPSSNAFLDIFRRVLKELMLYELSPSLLSSISTGMNPHALKNNLLTGLFSRVFQYIILSGRAFLPLTFLSCAMSINMSSIDMWLHTQIVGSCSSSGAVSSGTTTSTEANGRILMSQRAQNFPALKDRFSRRVVSMAPHFSKSLTTDTDMGRVTHMEAMKEHIAAFVAAARNPRTSLCAIAGGRSTDSAAAILRALRQGRGALLRSAVSRPRSRVQPIAATEARRSTATKASQRVDAARHAASARTEVVRDRRRDGAGAPKTVLMVFVCCGGEILLSSTLEK